MARIAFLRFADAGAGAGAGARARRCESGNAHAAWRVSHQIRNGGSPDRVFEVLRSGQYYGERI